jgi:hypothetical protein
LGGDEGTLPLQLLLLVSILLAALSLEPLVAAVTLVVTASPLLGWGAESMKSVGSLPFAGVWLAARPVSPPTVLESVACRQSPAAMPAAACASVLLSLAVVAVLVCAAAAAAPLVSAMVP